MPKGKVATEPVNKEIFIRVLKLKGYSIRKLVDELDWCSDKTIRRSLNNGRMRPKYIIEIARYIDVDPGVLTGKRIKQIEALDRLPIEKYPFFKAEQEKLMTESINETLRRVLSLYNISLAQYECMEFEKQYTFQHDLLTAVLPVIYKHFDRDGFGDTEMLSCQEIIIDLENYRENYYVQLFNASR